MHDQVTTIRTSATRLCAALAAAGVLAAGCAMNPVSGRPEMVLMSAAQEKEIGAEEAKKVEAQMGLLDDSPFRPYLDALGQRLAKESPRQDVTYEFHVADMAEPNAFALPGGYIYVTRGLLALVNAEDELAGVVGHEIGHVAARHTVQKISKQGPVAVVFGVASGLAGLVSPFVSNVIGGVGDLTQGLLFSPYGRSQETEADRIGQDMAARAGWDPAGLAAFFTTLGREVDLMSKEPRKPSYFDSHPPTPERVEKTTAHARELTRAAREPLSASREAFLARLDGMVYGQRAASGVFDKNSFLQPDMNFFMQFPEKWEHDNTPQKIAAVAPDKEAMVIVGAVAKGNDPLEGARAAEKTTKARIVERTKTLTIGELPAAHAQVPADGRVELDITWIAHGGLIYQIVGIAPTKRFETLQAVFHAVAHSFRPLSPAERAGIKEKRIRLVKARAGETPDALAGRTQAAWKGNHIAVVNGLAAGQTFADGQVVKIAVEETYEPKAK